MVLIDPRKTELYSMSYRTGERLRQGLYKFLSSMSKGEFAGTEMSVGGDRVSGGCPCMCGFASHTGNQSSLPEGPPS